MHHTLPRDNDRVYKWGQSTTNLGTRPYCFIYTHKHIDNWDQLFDPLKKPDIFQNQGEADASSRTDDPSIKIIVGDDSKKVGFDFQQYFQLLGTHLLGQNIIYGPVLTNDVMLCLDLLSMTQQGLTILADQQSDSTTVTGSNADQQFLCPLGSLVFSFKLQKVASNLVSHIDKLVGIAIVDSISNLSIVKSKKIDIKIKFIDNSSSHDIYGNNDKFGGILMDYTQYDDQYDVNLGSGINVLTDDTLGLNKIVGGSSSIILVSREEILAGFFNSFESMYFTFAQQGIEPFKDKLSKITL
ncbi:hypothetical protein CYY_007305 [Polysphondylium violaceum]|uniref:Uncharacterized protein n=1 Tax=Polysphondylium violaceum TaxID=133409 RepID=A0A8J4PS29_9MYCE|nr:hypothetical protein CYY_007305 [Polysphondylium violaceum]